MLIDFIAARLCKHVDDIHELRRRCRYRHKQIPKKRPGSARTVSIPKKELLDAQYSILKWLNGNDLFSQGSGKEIENAPRVRVHDAAHGFVPGRSIVTNAAAHRDAWVIITMDLEAWYDHVSVEKIRRALTKQLSAKVGHGPITDLNTRADVSLIVDLCTERGHLPTGAPTSPLLANVVAYWLDERLARRGWRYTRFADDLTFSSSVPVVGATDGGALQQFIAQVTEVIHSCGFRVATKKTKIRKRWQRQEVTGIIVNSFNTTGAPNARPFGVRVPREFKRIIRAVKHNLSKGRETKWTEEQLRSAEAFVQMVEKPICSPRRDS